MARLNRTCFTCGCKYSYCPSCPEDSDKPAWMAMFHDENCKDIFNVINENFYGHISDEDAIQTLNRCDLSINFTYEVRSDIEKLKNKKIVPKKVNKGAYTKRAAYSE